MELYPTLDMIGNYFTKALQGSQFCCFRNNILGIHDDDINFYNASGIALLEKQKINLERDKEEAHKDTKLASD